MQDKFYKFTTDDGFTFSVVEIPNSGMFQYELATDTGADIEQTFLNKTGRWVFGISHLIEHLSFKNTQDYDTETLMHLLKTEGAYNAYTDFDRIVYYYNTISRKFKTAITLTLNVGLNTLQRIPDHEFTSEKSVVANEIRRYHDDSQTIFSFNATPTAIGRNVNDNILGDADLLENFTLVDCVDVKCSFLKLANVVHRISFDPEEISLDEITDFVKSEYLRLSHNIPDSLVQISRQEYDAGAIKKFTSIDGSHVKLESNSEQSLIQIFMACEPKTFLLPTSMAQMYVGHMGSTSLNELIREKHGLTYGISFYHQVIGKQHAFVFSADVPKDKFDLTMSLFEEAIISSVESFGDLQFQELELQYELQLMNANMNRKTALSSHRTCELNPEWIKYEEDYKKSISSARKKIHEDYFTKEKIQEVMDEMKECVKNKKYIVIKS